MLKKTYSRDECQFMATTLEGVVSAIDILLNEADTGTSEPMNVAIALMRVAREKSTELSAALDGVNAPQPEATQ